MVGSKSPDDENHKEDLHKEFPFQGYIDDTARRAISLQQLRRISNFISLHCRDWRDLAPPHISATSGQPLCEDTLNLYHFNTWVILPATEKKDCAFVELLVGNDQVPSWFVSHWWGEAVQEFVTCVEEHARLRHLSHDTSFFWVCAYANRQHSLAQELVENPKETSFFRALQLSQGVLLVLDAHATAFSRIWCGFEEAVALTCLNDEDRQRDMLLDIATCKGGKACIITDGIVVEDQFHHWQAFQNFFGHIGERMPLVAERWYGPWNKAVREKDFPVEILQSGIRYAVEKGQSSMAVDRTRILNSIARRPLELEPPDTHDNYTFVNNKLSCRFALAGWRQLAERDLVNKLNLTKVMSRDISLRSVVLDFKGVKTIDDDAVAQIAVGLPTSVQRLDLAFIFAPDGKTTCGGHITSFGVTACAKGLPPNLRYLALDFSTNDLIDDEGVSNLAMCLPQSLEELYLRFNTCTLIGDAGVCAVAERLPKRLRVLELGFMGSAITDHSFIALAANLPSGLDEVVLNMNIVALLSDSGLTAITRALPASVKTLNIFAALCTKITDKGVQSMSKELPPSLESLRLSFSGCPKVTYQGYLSLEENMPQSIHDILIAGPAFPLVKQGCFRTPNEFRRWADRRRHYRCCRITCVHLFCIRLVQYLMLCMFSCLKRKQSRSVRRKRAKAGLTSQEVICSDDSAIQQEHGLRKTAETADDVLKPENFGELPELPNTVHPSVRLFSTAPLME